MVKNKEEYIEMEVVDWGNIGIALLFYPVLLIAGILIFVFNFIRYNLKLLAYLIICFIPIINLSIVVKDELQFFGNYDGFEFKLFDNLKVTKKFEIKR